MVQEIPINNLGALTGKPGKEEDTARTTSGDPVMDSLLTTMPASASTNKHNVDMAEKTAQTLLQRVIARQPKKTLGDDDGGGRGRRGYARD